MSTKLVTLLVSPPLARFSKDEWFLINKVRYRCKDDQQQLGERILEESKRLRDQIEEKTKSNKLETDRLFSAKISSLEFKIREYNMISKEIKQEINHIEFCKERYLNTINYIKSDGIQICRKCILMREGRVGIAHAQDDVDIELLTELDIMEAISIMMNRTVGEANEQIRLMRSMLYQINRDLENKEIGLKIEKDNANLDEHSLNLSIYHGKLPLANSKVTEEEWENEFQSLYEKAFKAKMNGFEVRFYMNTLIKQIVEDLQEQCSKTNEAFLSKIDHVKEAKMKLERKHNETLTQINEMIRNITNLEKSLAEKEGFMALAHTRLGNRGHRPYMELCRDTVESNLQNEIFELAQNIASLQQIISESQASLRYLLKTQIQLEEDINSKTNTLKIDEVDCLTLRQKLQFRAY